uniref:uncharacterized protein n=1 Tax=Semicossyphus pulcher TaxID=241346 RepID=UPI0037E87AF0
MNRRKDKFNYVLEVQKDQPSSAETQYLFYAVRDGDDVTLPCNNVIGGRQNCDSISWIFSDLRNTATVVLVQQGQIGENAGAKSDRLTVTSDCSLVMKKVKEEDADYFTCRKQNKDTQIYLSVITIVEQKKSDGVTLSCAVRTPGHCRYTVKWLFEGEDGDEYDQNVKTSQSDSHCDTTVSFLNPDISHASSHNVLKCEVTDGFTGDMKHLSFSPQSGNEDTTTTTTMNPPAATATPATTEQTSTTESSRTAAWWRFIAVSVGLSALIITVVTVNIWTQTKGRKTRRDENMVGDDHDGDDTVNYENIRPSAEN